MTTFIIVVNVIALPLVAYTFICSGWFIGMSLINRFAPKLSKRLFGESGDGYVGMALLPMLPLIWVADKIVSWRK